MKKIFTLLVASLSLSVAANAQRLINIETTMSSPAANATIDSGVSFNTSVIIKNVGNTTSKITDSIIYSIFLGNAGMRFNGDQNTTVFYRLKVLNPNDTIQVNRTFSINYTTTTNTDEVVDYCVVAAILNRSADSARDNMTADNDGCKSVTRKAAYTPGVSVENITAINDVNTLNNIYPNPASKSFTIDLSMTNRHNVSIRVMDITGRVVLTQERGVLAAGNYLMRLDTDKLQTGLYLYQVNIDGDVKAGKINIANNN